jgi:hypothetical protein
MATDEGGGGVGGLWVDCGWIVGGLWVDCGWIDCNDFNRKLVPGSNPQNLDTFFLEQIVKAHVLQL